MSVLFVVLPLAFLVAAGMVAAFVWAVRTGQYDDVETPAVRILHDQEPEPPDPAEPSADAREAQGPAPRDGEPPGA